MTTPNKTAEEQVDELRYELAANYAKLKAAKRESDIYRTALKKIAKPALGGKQQQYDAQQALAAARAALGEGA